MYAYAPTPLDEKIIILTNFSSGDKLFAFIRGFYGFKRIQKFFTKQMSKNLLNSFCTWFCSCSYRRYITLIKLKELMSQLTEQLLFYNRKNKPKLAPEKSFVMLLKVNFLGQELGYHTIKPIHSKIAANHKIFSPTGKPALLSFIGLLTFYTKLIEKLHINLKPFYDLLHQNTSWNWTEEKELFRQLKTALTSETELTIPKTNIHFSLQ